MTVMKKKKKCTSSLFYLYLSFCVSGFLLESIGTVGRNWFANDILRVGFLARNKRKKSFIPSNS